MKKITFDCICGTRLIFSNVGQCIRCEKCGRTIKCHENYFVAVKRTSQGVSADKMPRRREPMSTRPAQAVHSLQNHAINYQTDILSTLDPEKDEREVDRCLDMILEYWYDDEIAIRGGV